MLISRFLLARAGQGADQAEKEDNKSRPLWVQRVI